VGWLAYDSDYKAFGLHILTAYAILQSIAIGWICVGATRAKFFLRA
jgi:hypothetical protein